MSNVGYHGTGDDIKHIDHERFNHGDNALGPGFYITSNHKEANYYAFTSSGEHPNVLKVQHDIKNPMSTDHQFSLDHLHQIIKHSGVDNPRAHAKMYHTMYQDKDNPTNGVDIINGIHQDFYHSKNAHKLLAKVHELTGHDGVRSTTKDGSVHHVAWFPHQVKSAVSNHTFSEGVPNQERGLDIDRNKLPQVNVDKLLKDPLLHIVERRRNPQELVPSQGEFNVDKITSIVAAGSTQKHLVTSNDGYVIDGHHRWVAAHFLGEPVNTYEVQTDAKSLIDYLNATTYTDQIGVTEAELAEMSKRDLTKHIESLGWKLARTSGGHDVYKHPKSKNAIAVPRHKGDLAYGTVKQIQKSAMVEEVAAPTVSIGNGAIDNKVQTGRTKRSLIRRQFKNGIPKLTNIPKTNS